MSREIFLKELSSGLKEKFDLMAIDRQKEDGVIVNYDKVFEIVMMTAEFAHERGWAEGARNVHEQYIVLIQAFKKLYWQGMRDGVTDDILWNKNRGAYDALEELLIHLKKTKNEN